MADVVVDTKRLQPVARANLERIGRKHDGGYVVPGDAIASAGSLLSFGLAYDWDFERAFRKRNRGAAIRCWDHTTSAWGAFRQGKLFDYRRFFRDEAVHVRRPLDRFTIDDAFASVEKHAPTFVKMDIEGGEYEVWGKLMKREAAIDVIVVEFHFLDTRADDFNACMESALRHFHVVHVHGNNYAGTSHGFPCVIELTLEHKRRFEKEPAVSTLAYPVPGLDTPNDPARPDHPLSF